MNQLAGFERPVLQPCPRCVAQEFVQIENLGPSIWRYTCTRSCKRHADPYSWIGTTPDGPPDVELTDNKADDLDVPNDLLKCFAHSEPFLEYGVVEYRYATMGNPAVYKRLVDDYGHTALGPKQYTASAFIAGTLGRMEKDGILAYMYDKATGYWSYNGGISYWALRPASSDASPITYEAFARGRDSTRRAGRRSAERT
jgi:hypothetical protein